MKKPLGLPEIPLSAGKDGWVYDAQGIPLFSLAGSTVTEARRRAIFITRMVNLGVETAHKNGEALSKILDAALPAGKF